MRRCRSAAGALALLLLAGCATHQPLQADASAVRSFAARGYAPSPRFTVTNSLHEQWLDGRPVRLVLATPNDAAGALPLVIYLPGLGEPAEAGERWRQAWAGAGYAVLSIQPLAEDAAAWRSDLALDGNFKALGGQRFGAAAMNQRSSLLVDVVADAQRRAAAGDRAWQRIDWQRSAVAGFDLGAYTTMAMAGERVPGAEGAAGRLPMRAAIAISPYVAAAPAGALGNRFDAIRVPVLSITGDGDSDVIGLVASPATRREPFDRASTAGSALLWLQGLPHAEFSGSALTIAAANGPGPGSRRAGGAGPQGNEASGERSRGRRRRSDASAPPDDADGDPFDDGTGSRLSPTAVDIAMSALQQVSVAFLDATLKADPAAADWLARSAGPWLGGVGQLRRR